MKNSITRNFRRGLLVGTGLVAILLTFSPVMAQEEAATPEIKPSDEIITIGTRRKGRTIADSNVPIDVLSGPELIATGFTETNMLLANLLPSFNFPQPSITDGTDHVRPAQLRGLAPDHTLVLVNGKRRHSSAVLNLNSSIGRGSSSVDLNMIPANAIKRIEVLRDGAAAQYGSDAIAGVINVVMNDAREGMSLSATYGQYVTTMDGVPQLENVTVDVNGDLQFETGEDRTRRDGNTLTLRGNLGLPIGDEGFFNLSFEYRDRDPTNRSDFDPRVAYALVDGACGVACEFDPRELGYDRYNTTVGNSAVKDFTLFFNAGVPINDTFEAYALGSLGKRKGESAGFNRLPGNNRNVPAIYPDGFLPRITSDIDDVSLIGGIRGNVSGWDTDLSVVYGRNRFAFGVVNSLNTSLGANSPTEFEDGTLNSEQLVFNADFSKLVDLGMTNPVNLAFGAEYRDEKYQLTAGEVASYVKGPFPGPAGSSVFPGFQPASEVDDGRNSLAVHAELDADVSDQWNVAIAGRFEDYSDFGTTFNGKIATRYAISDQFALRGAVSTGFRAPSLAQQFFTSIATVFVGATPIETGTFRPDSDVAKALGSIGLDSESSLNFSGGAIWTADNGFNLSVDYYNIKITDRIVLTENLRSPDVIAILNAANVDATSARFFFNGIDTLTQGVDVIASYTADFDEMGTVALTAGLNINNTKVTDVAPRPAILAGITLGTRDEILFSRREQLRFEKGSPANKLNLAAIWNRNDLGITARTTRYGKTLDAGSTPAGDEVLPVKWVTDLDINYNFGEHYSIAFGANNIFDVQPTATRETRANPSTFDKIFPYSGFSPFGTAGRFLYTRISVKY